jgi:hypothetical protein
VGLKPPYSWKPHGVPPKSLQQFVIMDEKEENEKREEEEEKEEKEREEEEEWIDEPPLEQLQQVSAN